MLKHPENTAKDQKDLVIPNTPAAYFWYVTKPFKWWALGAIMVVIIASSLGQVVSYFFKLIIDAVEAGNRERAMYLVLLYPVAHLVVQLLYRASGFLGARWATSVKKYGFDSLSRHALQHSHSYFINRFAGAIMSKIQNIVGAVDSIVPELLWTYIPTFISFSVTLYFLLRANLMAGGMFMLLVIILFLINRKLAPTKAGYAKATAASATAFRAQLVDVISNVQAVRQYVKSTNENAGINKLTTAFYKNNLGSWWYTEKMLTANTITVFVFSLVMFWFLTNAWRADQVSTGDMVFLLTMYAQVMHGLLFIGRAFNQSAQAIGEMREGLDDLTEPFEIVDAPEAKELLVEEASVDWEKVGFKFDEKAVFADFDLHIPAGQRLGLVGQSGAGKTTFVSLLLRQHDLMDGSISINGENIAQVTQDSLRQAIAVVPQEPLLFHRTIKENILYGNPSVTDEELIEVAKKAQAHDFIMELPLGYDTMVGERGVKLSGGQKQRVAIARAMLKDAPILVLDEATSALDSESEVAIQKALEVLMEGRTVIAIAHRLSTLRKMDRIIVLEQGKIIEDGNHDELSRSGGVYERLWNHQAGGFLQDE